MPPPRKPWGRASKTGLNPFTPKKEKSLANVSCKRKKSGRALFIANLSKNSLTVKILPQCFECLN